MEDENQCLLQAFEEIVQLSLGVIDFRNDQILLVLTPFFHNQHLFVFFYFCQLIDKNTVALPALAARSR